MLMSSIATLLSCLTLHMNNTGMSKPYPITRNEFDVSINLPMSIDLGNSYQVYLDYTDGNSGISVRETLFDITTNENHGVTLDWTYNVRRSTNIQYYFVLDDNVNNVTYTSEYLYNYYEIDNDNDYFSGSESITYPFSSSVRNFTMHLHIMLIDDEIYAGLQTGSYQYGFDTGWQGGYDTGQAEGYANGYADGFQDADNMDSTALTIFTGILDIGMIPVNFFLDILNFEVFGINIGAFVTALMTIAIVIIIIRLFTGGKNND